MWEVLDKTQLQVIEAKGKPKRGLLIHGPAGTGKTAVAFHYVSLHAGDRAKVLYIAPTPALAAHIRPATMLGTLAEYNWRVMSLWELACRLLPEVTNRFTSDETLNSASPAKGAADGRLSACMIDSHRTLTTQARDTVCEYLRTALAVVRQVAPDLIDPARFPVQIGGATVYIDVMGYLQDNTLLSCPLEEAARAIFRSLYEQAGSHKLTRAFLNEGAFDSLVGALNVDALKVYHAATHKYLSMLNITDDRPRRIRREDLGGLILLASHLGRRLDESPDWVVIEEAQCFSPLVYEAIRNITPSDSRFVLTGDMEQQLSPQLGVTALEEVPNLLGLEEDTWDVVRLGHNYRTPRKIWDLAAGVLGTQERGKVTPFHPLTGDVVRHEVLPSDQLDRVVDTILDADQRQCHMIAVLAPTYKRAEAFYQQAQQELRKRKRPDLAEMCQCTNGSDPYRGKLVFGNLEAFQGLEADVVILVDVCTAFYADDTLSARRLHTAMTRARKRLVVVSPVERSLVVRKELSYVKKYAKHEAASAGRGQRHKAYKTIERQSWDLEQPEPAGRQDYALDSKRRHLPPLLSEEPPEIFRPFDAPRKDGNAHTYQARYSGADEGQLERSFNTKGHPGVFWATRACGPSPRLTIELLGSRGEVLATLVDEHGSGSGCERYPTPMDKCVVRIKSKDIAWAATVGRWVPEKH